MKYPIVIAAALLTLLGCKSMQEKNTEVLVAGGSASGVTAALQAARQGADVVLVSPHAWLGGMLTAAGVSATDGNHKLPSGIWGEFRQELYKHYGGPEAVETGWVSNTLFEPHVGDSIFKAMVAREKNIDVIYNHRPSDVLRKGHRITGVVFTGKDDTKLRVKAGITIAATELGDVMALAGVPYSVGQDAASETGEIQAPSEATDIIQDLTYVAILKAYPEGEDHTLPRPKDYDPEPFRCACAEVCPEEKDVLSCDKLLTYGRLPNEKYMINWPNNGNDYYANLIEKTPEERQKALRKAKNETLSFIYFLQTEAGYTKLGLARDEFPTKDHLPLIAYHRESRRMNGLIQLTLMDIKNPFQAPNGALYKTGIAVGDYPIDHHHTKYPGEVQEGEFPKIPSYNIPYVCLIPPDTKGLLVAEKSISISHLANGTTRLQPVVMQIGQAAGSAAALCLKHNTTPKNLPVRSLQRALLDAGCWIMPYADTDPGSSYFKSIMRTGATGIMRGEGEAVAWANRTWFYPDSAVSGKQLGLILKRAGASDLPELPASPTPGEGLSWVKALAEGKSLKALQPDIKQQEALLEQLKLPDTGREAIDQPLKRKHLAWILDKVLAPFEKPVSLLPEHAEE